MFLPLTRAEYWLLETVVEEPCPCSFLDPRHYEQPTGLEEMFNKPGHGLGRDDLIETLARMAEHGWIEALSNGQPTSLTQPAILQMFTAAPRACDPACAMYRLTPQGGAVWEAFAAPDWSRRVTEELDDDANRGRLTGMEAWRVEKYLRYLGMLQLEVDFPSVQIEEIGPWNATYWKELPRGYCAQFRWNYRESLEANNSDLFRLTFAGFCQFRDDWYRWR